MKTILLTAALMGCSAIAHAREKPIEHLLYCIGVSEHGGRTVAIEGALHWPRIVSEEPKKLTPWHGYLARVTTSWPRNEWRKFLAANEFRRDKADDLLAEVPALKGLFKDPHSYSRMMDLPRLGRVEVRAFISEGEGEETLLELYVTQLTRIFVAPYAPGPNKSE